MQRPGLGPGPGASFQRPQSAGGSHQLAVGSVIPGAAPPSPSPPPSQPVTPGSQGLARTAPVALTHRGYSSNAPSAAPSQRGSGRSTPDGSQQWHQYHKINRQSSPGSSNVNSSQVSGNNSPSTPSNWRFPTLSPARLGQASSSSKNLSRGNSGGALDRSMEGCGSVSLSNAQSPTMQQDRLANSMGSMGSESNASSATLSGVPVPNRGHNPVAAALANSPTPTITPVSRGGPGSRAQSHDRQSVGRPTSTDRPSIGHTPLGHTPTGSAAGSRSHSMELPVYRKDGVAPSPRPAFPGTLGLGAMHRDFDQQVEAMRGAFEESMKALREGPRLSMPAQPNPAEASPQLAHALLAAAAALHRELGSSPQATTAAPSTGGSVPTTPTSAAGGQWPDNAGAPPTEGKQEVLTALVTLQKNIEQQQGAQSTLIANLTAQWEQRFVALEQAVNSGLKIATTTAASMNERSGKFLRLGEVLEGALDRIVDDGKDMASLSQSMSKTQRDVERISQELNDEKSERRQGIADLARQLESQVATLRERMDTSAAAGGGSTAGGSFFSNMGSFGGAKEAPALERLQNEVGRLQRELSEECTERRQLARELQLTASDVSSLKEKLDAANDQLLRFSRDLNSSREEVRQIANEVARVYSVEVSNSSSGDGLPRQKLDGEFAQRLEGLNSQLRGKDGSSQRRGLEASDGSGIDAMRRGITQEIVAAVHATQGKVSRSDQQTSQRRSPLLGTKSMSRRPATIPEEDNPNAASPNSAREGEQQLKWNNDPHTGQAAQPGEKAGASISALLKMAGANDTSTS